MKGENCEFTFSYIKYYLFINKNKKQKPYRKKVQTNKNEVHLKLILSS